MKCPVDGERLVVSERYGVEIDYCPECRGVWLDRGELDKIIERSRGDYNGRDTRSDHRRYDDYRDRKRKKKSSFLEEIFDF